MKSNFLIFFDEFYEGSASMQKMIHGMYFSGSQNISFENHLSNNFVSDFDRPLLKSPWELLHQLCQISPKFPSTEC